MAMDGDSHGEWDHDFSASGLKLAPYQIIHSFNTSIILIISIHLNISPNPQFYNVIYQ